MEANSAKVRRAVSTDTAAVRELTRAAYAKWVPVIGREPTPMKADYDAAVRDHLIDLLHVDGQLAALIETTPEADHLLIKNVAVLPTFQGHGYGCRLLAHAETLAASLGLSEMRLYTNKDFAANVRLYLGLGYRVDREEAFMGGTTIHMSKQLRLLGSGAVGTTMDASTPPTEAELAVQGQLEAYNARDIDAFMHWWAEDCRYYEFPDRLLASGAAEVRERHAARFKEPNLHGRLIKRIAIADVVVDQEIVSRTFPDGPGEVDVIAIYEVACGRIAKAWFKMGPQRLLASGSRAQPRSPGFGPTHRQES